MKCFVTHVRAFFALFLLWANRSLWHSNEKNEQCFSPSSRPSFSSILCDLSDYDPETPSLAALQAVVLCPYDEDLIATVGYDSELKIWSMKQSVYKPIYKKAAPTTLGWLYDAQWDPLGRGIFVGGSSQPILWWDAGTHIGNL